MAARRSVLPTSRGHAFESLAQWGLSATTVASLYRSRWPLAWRRRAHYRFVFHSADGDSEHRLLSLSRRKAPVLYRTVYFESRPKHPYRPVPSTAVAVVIPYSYCTVTVSYRTVFAGRSQTETLPCTVCMYIARNLHEEARWLLILYNKASYLI